MNIEEKAKAYDEALKRAKDWETEREQLIYPREIVESIFPQLRESEDEKAYKRIEQLIRLNTSGAEKTSLLAYLEKQKEQKPLIKKGVKYYCIKAQKRCTDFYTYAFTVGTEYIAPENNVLVDNDGHSWDLTRQTPEWIFERFTPKESKQEWSDEDKKLLDFWLDVIDRNDWRMDEDFCKASREFINRLKSLRPYWKPSEEQEEPKYYQHFDPDC